MQGPRFYFAEIALPRRIALIAAWGLMLLIMVWTWGPVSVRPSFGDPQVERFAGYFAAGLAFGLAYRRPLLVGAALIAMAAVLELGQNFIPGRDAGWPDLAAKGLGAASGISIGVLARRWLGHRRSTERTQL